MARTGLAIDALGINPNSIIGPIPKIHNTPILRPYDEHHKRPSSGLAMLERSLDSDSMAAV